jgi:hypothetical protein
MHPVRVSKKWAAVLFLLLFAGAGLAQNGGTFGAYLVGTYDTRENAENIIQIVNPTANQLSVRLFFFDDNGSFVRRIDRQLNNNDMVAVDVRELKLKTDNGVVKVLSYIGKAAKNEIEVKAGVVGFMRHRTRGGVADINLAAVPESVLGLGELKILLAH